jgi:hypothetical protein
VMDVGTQSAIGAETVESLWAADFPRFLQSSGSWRIAEAFLT